MAIRTRKGGVYDWDVPGPNRGQDSQVRRRTVGMRSALTAVPRWSRKGKREVRMGVGGHTVGYIHRDLTVCDTDGNVLGQAKTFRGGLNILGASL